MIRRLAAGLLLLLLIVLSGLVVGCEEELPDGAIAQVGQKFVSQEQLDGLEATYVMAGKAPDKATHPSDYLAFKQKLVEYLVTMEIMRQQAPEYNVTITSSDVEARLAHLVREFASSCTLRPMMRISGCCSEMIWVPPHRRRALEGRECLPCVVSPDRTWQ